MRVGEVTAAVGWLVDPKAVDATVDTVLTAAEAMAPVVMVATVAEPAAQAAHSSPTDRTLPPSALGRDPEAAASRTPPTVVRRTTPHMDPPSSMRSSFLHTAQRRPVDTM
eukprot:2648357-Prymnesium_polylepis.1